MILHECFVRNSHCIIHLTFRRTRFRKLELSIQRRTYGDTEAYTPCFLGEYLGARTPRVRL